MNIVISDKVKRLLPLGLAALFGGLALVGVRRYIADQLAAQRQALEEERQQILANYPPPVRVIVASKDVPEASQLDKSNLKFGEVPERYLQPYAAREPEQVVGRVTMAPLAAGEQVLLNKIRRPEDVPAGSTLSNLVPKGKRAVTIAVDTITGVGGFVRPGDIVDILWTVALPGEGGTQPVTMTLFQDVPVMAIEKEFRGRAGPRRTSTEEGEEGDVLEEPVLSGNYTVTLALAPQEIAFLLFAREQGRVQLSLRPRNEGGAQVAVAPANINTLLGAMLGVDTTAPAAKPDRQIELYKGLERGVVVVPGEQGAVPAQGAARPAPSPVAPAPEPAPLTKPESKPPVEKMMDQAMDEVEADEGEGEY